MKKHYCLKVELMQKQINKIQKDFSLFISMVDEGQSVSDLLTMQDKGAIKGIDQTEVICRLQEENKQLQAKLIQNQDEKILFLDSKSMANAGP